MASLEEIRASRLEKLKFLEEKGIDPFPVDSKQEITAANAKKDFEKLESLGETSHMVGRILSIREQGKIIFLTFDDGTGSFQALLKLGEPLSKEEFELFQKAFDIGDFVELKGTFFLTQKGEKTILAENLRMLAKSLRPLPEKWHGLQDIEERFRKRYLDLLSNSEVKERFIVRSKIVGLIRQFYSDAGYIEVDLPNLQPLAGGATAAPFKTHHNTLDIDFFLPVTQELYLKELLVGGMNKVFEIGKRFRNEGIDPMHNPEFTMLESNEAYADAKSQREFIEKLFKYVVKGVFGKYEIECDGETIDFGPNFEIITFYELLRRYADIENPEKLDREEAARVAEKLGVAVAPEDELEKILDNIYKKTARPDGCGSV